MRVAVLTFPGSNCDQDLFNAVAHVGGHPEYLWHRERGLDGFDAVLLPGGFSYGDYLRAGAIARFSPVMDDVAAFAARGGTVVGICNGFQILCEAGLLPGALIRNVSLRFQSEDTLVRVERTDTRFTQGYDEGQVLRMPMAHAEGNYRADDATLARLEGEGRVLFRYCDAHGRTGPDISPNGSMNGIAGIMNEGGNVLGMMPHPERALEPLHGSSDGLALFASIVGAPAAAPQGVR